MDGQKILFILDWAVWLPCGQFLYFFSPGKLGTLAGIFFNFVWWALLDPNRIISLFFFKNEGWP
jgi:hypothetical protein